VSILTILFTMKSSSVSSSFTSKTLLRQLPQRSQRTLSQIDSYGRHERLYAIPESEALIHYIRRLYPECGMESIQAPPEYKMGTDTMHHARFYNAIHNDSGRFKRLYCALVRTIFDTKYPDEKGIVYQSFPSIRFQFNGTQAVPPHRDSDKLANHPIGEENWIVAITAMHGTNAMYIERDPGSGEKHGMELKSGQMLHFDGNQCIHGNWTNQERQTRISLDFRVMRLQPYLESIRTLSSIQHTKPTDRKGTRLVVGGYYQIMFETDSPSRILLWRKQDEWMPVLCPTISDKEADDTSTYLKSGGYMTEHHVSNVWSKEIGERLGVKYVELCTSGTSALYLALTSILNGPSCMKSSSIVIIPAATQAATVQSVLAIGAKPLIVDVDPESFTMTLPMIEKSLELSDISLEDIIAVIHVSLNNCADGLSDIVDWCKTHTIPLIEDAAQSLGCTYKNRPLGTWGDIGCFSLSNPKIITTGQGGIVVTPNSIYADRIHTMKNFGRLIDGNDESIHSFGMNFKFTDIQATIGRVQWKSLDQRIQHKNAVYSLYSQLLGNTLHTQIRPKPDGDIGNEWFPWCVELIMKDKKSASLMVSFLARHNIGARQGYPNIGTFDHLLCKDMIANSTDDSVWPHADEYHTGIVLLPSYSSITPEDVAFVCRLIQMYDYAIECKDECIDECIDECKDECIDECKDECIDECIDECKDECIDDN